MSREVFDDKYDLAKIIIKPLYFGLIVNVAVPMVLLMVCYYVNNNNYLENRVGTFANELFYLFGALALAEAVLALWWRSSLFKKPMIRRSGTFETDFTSSLLSRTRVIFLVIASICIYGYVYYFVSGRFQEAVFFVVFSFVVFQVVRPRYGWVRKLISHQKSLVARGEFLSE